MCGATHRGFESHSLRQSGHSGGTHPPPTAVDGPRRVGVRSAGPRAPSASLRADGGTLRLRLRVWPRREPAGTTRLDRALPAVGKGGDVLPNAIAVANGKGGVGKTSLSANLAGLAAISGWRVLLVDLDPQGNLGSDLGYTDEEANDGGAALLRAAESGEPVEPLRDVRPNLDVVTGGPGTETLETLVRRRLFADDATALTIVDAALAPMVGDYNLVVVDCPPAMGCLVELAFTVARYLVIPTRGDAASLNGLSRTANRFVNVRRTSNPHIDLLGICLFGFGAQDHRIVAKARHQLEEALDGIAPVFDSFIRHSRKAPDDMRELGLLAHEYAQTAAQAPRWFEDRDAVRYSTSADALASDYQALTKEILTAFAERQAAISAAA
ncbi:MAG: AAA family ATPase [Acidimicrobiia bacterium]|nr:AAA family ATPase [Acidimicrobiia bacterium]